MAQLSKTAFLSKWATLFADNTTGEISEQDVRDFRQDVSDSFLSISDNFIDEDSFATNSATAAPSQQSTKAYVDGLSAVGVQDLFIPASAMWPAITDGCAPLAQSEIATSLFNIQTLDFDQTTEEHAQFQVVLPRKWNNLTFTFVPYWTASAGTPGQTVRWQMNGAAYANDDSLTTAPGSSIAVDDTLLATNDLHIGAESSPVTLSNTPASADFLMLQIHRGVASDDLAADAKLLGISIRITTTAAKDA